MKKTKQSLSPSPKKTNSTALKILTGVVSGAAIATAVVLVNKKKRQKLEQGMIIVKKKAMKKLYEIKQKTNSLPSVKKVKKTFTTT